METTVDSQDTSSAVETVAEQTPASQESPDASVQTETPASQDTVQSQVETPVPATSEDQGRVQQQKPKPSEFYEARRENRQLKTTVSALERQVQELINLQKQKPPESVQPKPKPDIFVDPEAFLTEREQRLRQEIKQELLNEIRQTSQQSEMDRTKQEAVEMLFPKSGPEDSRSLQQRIEANPELAEKIAKVEKEMGIHAVSNMNPKQGAALILKILEADKPKPITNPTAIKKTLVGSTATGSPITAGGKVMPTLQEIQVQLKELDDKVAEDSNFRYEPEYTSKMSTLMSQLTALTKNSGKQ